MKAHFQYLSYVLRHKWFVFVACRSISVGFWQAIIHDWSKFRPREWFPYVDYFYRRGGKGKHSNAGGAYSPGCDDAFDTAWLFHQHANPHHHQHWLTITLYKSIRKCYNSDRLKEELCEPQNSANDADLSAQSRISQSTVSENTDVPSVMNTGKNIAQNTEKPIKNLCDRPAESTIGATHKPIETGQSKMRGMFAVRHLFTTAAIRRAAHVVARAITSSLHWIIPMAAANNTANVKASCLVCKHIAGYESAAFPKDFACYATTAIQPSDTTVTVLIRKTQILVNDDGTCRCMHCGLCLSRNLLSALPMPEKYLREMIADWIGAGRAQGHGDDVEGWYERNKEKMVLHPDTRARLEDLLSRRRRFDPPWRIGTILS
jgi:uncharacterized protein DUF5662